MEIIASPTDWIANDAERLAAFLDTETGKRLIPKLSEETPVLLAKGDVNEILIRSGEVRGVGLILASILRLAHPVKSSDVTIPPDNYPPLDNDAAWNDGQKLDPNPKPPKE